MPLQPRAVLVHRASEFDELVARHGTRGQAEFLLASRGRAIDEIEHRHLALARAVETVTAAIPAEWRRAAVERRDLARFVFGPEDVVIVVGQDGLVANVAKYLDGQPVVGVDPDPGRNPGVLVPHRARDARDVIRAVHAGARVESRTMVEARSDDGQTLRALNEVFVGHASHQSARYAITAPGCGSERQSSSGVLVGTGTGATGWLRSVSRGTELEGRLPTAVDPALAWFAREPWPSAATGATLAHGLVDAGSSVRLDVESDRLVCFGDGMESDAIELGWGQSVTIARAAATLELVVG